MTDKINIELDENFLKKLYSLTDSLPPNLSEINLQALKKQLFDIEQILTKTTEELEAIKAKPRGLRPKPKPKEVSEEQMQQQGDDTVERDYITPSPQQVQPSQQFIIPTSQQTHENENLTRGRILIIDDLGVITYQLGVMFKRMGYEVTVSKEIYEAIEKFKRNIFNYVVMDLFIPTEREGFILLEELKKISINRQQNTVIGVMSASTRKEHKLMCANKGAEFYVEKLDDWQKEISIIFETLENKNSGV